ncbi:MAG: thiol-disulfide isomerase/thioredoxin [Myxococcota bacterium]|jgi:thiol-disulfide isomerase/thioredoxin
MNMLLLLASLAAHAEDNCAVDPSTPLQTIQTSELPALIASRRGCVVLMEVYASWCGTCTRTAPAVSAMASRLQPEGLVLIGVSVDSSPGKLLAWREHFGAEYPPIIVEGWTLDGLTAQLAEMEVAFHEAIPLFVLFDQQGHAVLQLTEPDDLVAIEARAKSLLSGPQ